MENLYRRFGWIGYLWLCVAAVALLLQSNVAEAACRVVEGVQAEIAAGPREAAEKLVTLRAAWTAEFVWNMQDKESVGWMKIRDEHGDAVGWLPPGHEGIRCSN